MTRTNYIAIADLNMPEQKLINLSWDKEDGGTPARNETRINACIEDACNEIDRHVGQKYKVPLDPFPDSMKPIACHIAIYMLYSRRQPMPADSTQFINYKDAVGDLEKIEMGTSTVPNGVSLHSALEGIASSGSVNQEEPTFGRENLKDF